jgi:hypothetical protein
VKAQKKEKRRKLLKELNPNPQHHKREQGLKLVKYQNLNLPNMADGRTAGEMVKDEAYFGNTS